MQAARACRNRWSGGTDVVSDSMLGWLIGGAWTKEFRELGEHSSVWILRIEARQSRTIRHSTCGDAEDLQVRKVVCQSRLPDVDG